MRSHHGNRSMSKRIRPSDRWTLKACLDCGREKERGKGRKWCNACRVNHTDEVIKARREKLKQRTRTIRWQYNLQADEYDAILAHQGGGCGVCGVLATQEKKEERAFLIDHDHNTGSIRGILCKRCNIGLAWLEKKEWRNMAEHYLRVPQFSIIVNLEQARKRGEHHATREMVEL